MVTREYTIKIIEMVEEGLIDKDTLINNLLSWMSESDVKEFYEKYYHEEDIDY